MFNKYVENKVQVYTVEVAHNFNFSKKCNKVPLF